MKGPVPLLDGTAYVETVGPLEMRGFNPSTHLANVRYPGTAAAVLSVVKLLPPDGREACNEAMGTLFLHAAGVPTPRTAALLVLPEARAVQAVGHAVALPFVNSGLVLAWAAERLPVRSIRALFSGTRADDEWLRVLATAEGAAIAAFDEVFGNADRNTGNILFASRNECWAIDHSQLFGMQHWLQSRPRDPGSCHSVRTLQNAHRGGQLPDAAYTQACARLVAAAEQHRAAFNTCRRDVARLLQTVHGHNGRQGANHVLSFVARRTARHWMAERMGML